MRSIKFLVILISLLLSLGGCSVKTTSDNSSTSESKKSSKSTNEAKSKDVNIMEFNVDGVKFTMVEVEGGTFVMGDPNYQNSPITANDGPVHQVTVSSFSIGQTEVTQELWQAVMGDNPSKFKGAKLPVENVSWDDCQEFIHKLNEKTGKNFRLPTEAEWEYAARGGNNSQHYKYSGSNDPDDVAWFIGNSDDNPHDVATKQTNELGIYDMSGNVYEWCSDWYGDYSNSSQTNPQGPNGSDSGFRVCRGGDFSYLARDCCVSHRNWGMPFRIDSDSNFSGLRLAL